VGVRQDSHGNVVVNSKLRTSNPRIWAAGDVTGLPQFTHIAGVNASVAATNAILGLTRNFDRAAIPRVTFTQPEVGAVGLQAADAATLGHRIVTRHHQHVDRAVTESKTDGFTQLVVGRSGRVLGGTVVGPRAGESFVRDPHPAVAAERPPAERSSTVIVGTAPPSAQRPVAGDHSMDRANSHEDSPNHRDLPGNERNDQP
jgi:hypothetical protein